MYRDFGSLRRVVCSPEDNRTEDQAHPRVQTHETGAYLIKAHAGREDGGAQRSKEEGSPSPALDLYPMTSDTRPLLQYIPCLTSLVHDNTIPSVLPAFLKYSTNGF